MTASGTPLLRWPSALIASVMGGALLWCAFAPVAVPALAIPALALVVASVWRGSVGRGAACGALAGLGFFTLLLAWMHIIGIDAWLLLAAFCAGWWTLMGIGLALVTRLPAAPIWAGCVLVLQEALRGRVPWGGFAWGDVAFSAPGGPLVGWSTLAGSAAVSFLTMVAAASVVSAVARRGVSRSLAWGALALIAALGGLLVPAGLGITPSGSTTMAVIQGGTPQLGMGAMDVRRAVLDSHVAQTLALALEVQAHRVAQPDVVLWPENSSDLDPYADPEAAAAITAAARAINAPIIVGAVVLPPGDPGGLWNTGIVWDPQTGPGQRYIKTHPVPFGEFLPFRAQLAGLIGRFDRVPRDFRPGTQPGLLTVAGTVFGDVICFEVADDDVVRGVVDGGAQVLTVQTNNATYGDTAQPDQQFTIERLRARETGRTVVVAATTGISGMIGPDGSASASLPQDAVGSLVQSVARAGGRTPGAVIGSTVELLLCLLAVASMLAAVIVSARRRSIKSRAG